MEIIERGTPPEEKVYEGRCMNCKTKVRFKRSEGKVTFDQRDGNFVTVKCPVCRHAINVYL